MKYIINKYSKWYFNIIFKAQQRNIEENVYYEKHHIVPRSLGGNDDKENLVLLYPREHFICHLLLPKMLLGNKKKKMCFALYRIANRFISNDIQKINSYTYQQLKKKAILQSSEIHKGKIISDKHKKSISAANRGKTLTEEHKEKVRQSKIGKKRKPFSEEHRKNMSLCKIGKKNANFQKSFSQETRKKISEIARKRARLSCPHCSKSATPPNFARWHGDKCKYKKEPVI